MMQERGSGEKKKSSAVLKTGEIKKGGCGDCNTKQYPTMQEFRNLTKASKY